MLLVNLFDLEFDHSYNEDGFYTASMGVKPTKISYVKNHYTWDGITIFTDRLLHKVKEVTSKVKIAWLVESPGIHPYAIEACKALENSFDLIITHNQELLERNPKYKRYSVGSLRVKNPCIPNKTKHCSVIASNKTQLEGHQLRHKIIKTFESFMFDIWGSGYQKFECKEEALHDYRFSIAVMNVSSNNYFTEILTDCFALGTIPIFWGCPNIGEFFNSDGIIQFSTIDDLNLILPRISPSLYKSKYEAIVDNFDRVKNYKSTDDNVAQIIIDEIINGKISSYNYL